MKKFTSRKFLCVVLVFVILVLEATVGLSVDSELLKGAVKVASYYVLGEAGVDAVGTYFTEGRVDDIIDEITGVSEGGDDE